MPELRRIGPCSAMSKNARKVNCVADKSSTRNNNQEIFLGASLQLHSVTPALHRPATSLERACQLVVGTGGTAVTCDQPRPNMTRQLRTATRNWREMKNPAFLCSWSIVCDWLPSDDSTRFAEVRLRLFAFLECEGKAQPLEVTCRQIQQAMHCLCTPGQRTQTPSSSQSSWEMLCASVTTIRVLTTLQVKYLGNRYAFSLE